MSFFMNMTQNENSIPRLEKRMQIDFHAQVSYFRDWGGVGRLRYLIYMHV